MTPTPADPEPSPPVSRLKQNAIRVVETGEVWRIFLIASVGGFLGGGLLSFFSKGASLEMALIAGAVVAAFLGLPWLLLVPLAHRWRRREGKQD